MSTMTHHKAFLHGFAWGIGVMFAAMVTVALMMLAVWLLFPPV